jgi:hypothetical protein
LIDCYYRAAGSLFYILQIIAPRNGLWIPSPNTTKINMSDDALKIGLRYQNLILASANLYFSSSCEVVFVTSEITRTFALCIVAAFQHAPFSGLHLSGTIGVKAVSQPVHADSICAWQTPPVRDSGLGRGTGGRFWK